MGKKRKYLHFPNVSLTEILKLSKCVYISMI